MVYYAFWPLEFPCLGIIYHLKSLSLPFPICILSKMIGAMGQQSGSLAKRARCRSLVNWVCSQELRWKHRVQWCVSVIPGPPKLGERWRQESHLMLMDQLTWNMQCGSRNSKRDPALAGGMWERTPERCPLASTCTSWQVCVCIHTYIQNGVVMII